MSHTPGPWILDEDSREIKIENGAYIARAYGPDLRLRGKEWIEENGYCEANARLIAAAPDLLEALKFMVDRFENLDGLIFSQRHAMDKARAAIAAAENAGKGE